MGKEISVLDDLLLRAASGGKSGVEIQRITGIPADQAVQHVKQLLASRDIWTEHEQRLLLLQELQELKESLQDSAIKGGDPDSARLLLKTLELIGKRLDSQRVNIDENMLKLTKFQEEILLRAMDSALNFAKKQLAERYPEIPIYTLDELVADGLTRAKYEIIDD
jgi:DNA helicase HerA-like ATPase